MDSKHITRDYSAHRKSVIRPTDEYVKLEIFSFDPKYTRTYLLEDGTLKSGENCTETSWKSWTCFKSSDKQNRMIFDLEYIPRIVGEYRIDLIYEQNSYIHKTDDGKNSSTNTSDDLLGTVIIDGEEESIKFDGEDNVIKRITLFKDFTDSSKSIHLEIPHNCYFYGLIIRKIIKFVGDNYYGDALGSEEGNMVLTNATITNSSMTKPTELSCNVFYDDAFECDASPSGFYIDYHDEVNFYVKTNDGSVQQVFGGYVSSILPDSDRTKLTIACADRLVDGQNKYVLDQMRLHGGSTNVDDTGYANLSKDFESYPKALKYLCDIHEVTLKSNISNDFTVDGEKFHEGFVLGYGSDKQIKSIKASNGITKTAKNYIMLRNKASSEKNQTWTLYKAKDNAKTPVEITNYPYMHITYGLGEPKTEYDTKSTETIDTSDTTAGSQKFTKCGVSEDGKYLMAIGLPSAGKDSQKGWTKTVFKRKCPHCGSTNLIWDWNWGSFSQCRGAREGGSVEGHIFCKGCDADYSVQGYEHINGSKYHMEKASSTVSSSKAEAQKLKNGEMVAVPSTAVTVTSDDVFKAISKIAFKYKYRLGGGSSSYSTMKKRGYGDCWAFSDLIFEEMKKYKIGVKIVEYSTNMSDKHHSVMYKDEKGKWADFPYREYGWNTKYNNMLNNTSGSKNGRVVNSFDGSSIGNIKTTTNNTKSQTTTVKHSKGWDKDKPFQAFLRLEYSLAQSFDADKYLLDIKFTLEASSDDSLNSGLNLYWVNNTVKQTTLKLANNKTLIDYLKTIHGENAKIYLQSIQMIAPKRTATKENEDVDWYKSDESTDDNSSCKMKLYQITFDDNPSTDSSDLQSCGKSVNSMIQEIVNEAGYYVNMSYGLHRKDDVINFKVNTQSSERYTATEGDNNNILSWNSISYSPIGSLYNMSMQVFKTSKGEYKYIDTRDGKSILEYGEQCTLQTSNNTMNVREAYFNSYNSSKYNPQQTYTFTITVPNCPNIVLGDLVKVVANAKKLNTLKELNSIKITFDYGKVPRIQTELGLGELAPDIQLKQNIRELRGSVKEESTEFSSSATPVEDNIYYVWDK